MALSILVIVANIVLRRFFNAPIYGSTEIIQYLGLFVASMAIVETEWSSGNIVMSLFLDMAPQRVRNVILTIEFTINSIAMIVLDYLLFQDVIAKFLRGTLTSELKISRWIPSMVLAIGFVGLTLVLIVKTVIHCHMAITGKEIDFIKLGNAGMEKTKE